MPCYYFKGPGFLLEDVPQNIQEYLTEKIKEVEEDNSKFESAAPKLAGIISKEFYIEERNLDFLQFTFDCIDQYENTFGFLRSAVGYKTEMELYLSELWINFQKKHDYNPIHKHSGVLSFVIWAQVPYLFEEEKKARKFKQDDAAACFNFHYTDTIGAISQEVLPVDKTWEWKIALFPAALCHSVNPFITSEETRISFAGNFAMREI